MADEECVLIDEKLAEAVREFPVLFDKSLKDFRDRNKMDLAWRDVATSVGFASGKDAESAFKNLRNRYRRDKKKLQGVKVSGTDTKSVNDVKSETSDMFSYLAWLDIYIKPRRSPSNMVLSLSQEGSNIDEEEATDYKTDPSLDSDCNETTVIKSKTTGRTKNIKRSKREDFESAGIELIKSIRSKIDQRKETERDKDEEPFFQN